MPAYTGIHIHRTEHPEAVQSNGGCLLTRMSLCECVCVCVCPCMYVCVCLRITHALTHTHTHILSLSLCACVGGTARHTAASHGDDAERLRHILNPTATPRAGRGPQHGKRARTLKRAGRGGSRSSSSSSSEEEDKERSSGGARADERCWVSRAALKG
jgi:hypothetical protein